MNKRIIVLLIFYSIKMLFTSCRRCEPITYTYEYTGIEVTAWDTSKSLSQEVKDTVLKSSFGLSIRVLSKSENSNTVAIVVSGIQNSFSIPVAYGFAIDKPCLDDFVACDSIERINIYTLQGDNKIDVTNKFKFFRNKFEVLGVNEAIPNSINSLWQHLFIDLVDYQSIPNQVRFRVNIELQSGKVFSDTTPIIVFK